MNSYHDKDDNTLVQQTLLGDESAFAELVTRYERAVMGTALKVTNNTFSAEDATQDAFVSAWMNLSALRQSEKFGSWVCSIAKNHARTLISHYRSAIPTLSLNEFENLDLCEEEVDIFKYDDLNEHIKALSQKIREVIELHYFCDLSVKEIAKRLSISEGTVKWRLSEGRKQLRKGYGIMEKTYNENEAIVARVMRQVEALKLWRLKDDKSGFEAEYKAVLALVNELPDSKEKSHALADTWLMGAWFISGQSNDEVYNKIKKAAEYGHNEDVMESVASYEADKYSGDERINYRLNTQIPYFKEKGFLKALGYTWFWLGFDYRQKNEFEKAIDAYNQVLQVLTPDMVYYANAKAAIYAENALNNQKQKSKGDGISASGEVYRYIDGKLYFWEQPGYSTGRGYDIHTTSLFWNLATYDSLLFDPDMKVGDSVSNNHGYNVLKFVSNNEICETPAGRFENCLCYEFTGDNYGLSYCKTYICKGVGIVKQEVKRSGVYRVWHLQKYIINGGDGMIPFCEGNRWDYCSAIPDTAAKYERELFFEVTAFKNNAATVASVVTSLCIEYLDTFEGKIEEFRATYVNDADNELIDTRKALRRAKELAQTKAQKAYADVALQVADRIFETDNIFNPDYIQKGRWNFFERRDVAAKDGSVTLVGGENEHFEWKDSSNLGTEGHKMLYSFFDEIVYCCGMRYWSDKWTPGFTMKPVKGLVSFEVLNDETVTTSAGTFENCRHINFELNFNSYWGGKADIWYADGIGFVKFVHKTKDKVDAVWQLTEYKGKGCGYFPIDDGLYRKYEPENLGDGYHAALEYTFVDGENGISLLRNATGTQDRENYEKSLKVKA